MSLEACDFIGKKCEHCGTLATSGKIFFLHHHIQNTSTSYNAEDIPDSVSCGKERDEVYPYSGPSFSADESEYSSSDSELTLVSTYFRYFFYHKNSLLVSVASKRKVLASQ